MYDRLFSPIQIRGLELKNRGGSASHGVPVWQGKREKLHRDSLLTTPKPGGRRSCGLNIVEVAAVHTPSAPAHFVSIRRQPDGGIRS